MATSVVPKPTESKTTITVGQGLNGLNTKLYVNGCVRQLFVDGKCDKVFNANTPYKIGEKSSISEYNFNGYMSGVEFNTRMVARVYESGNDLVMDFSSTIQANTSIRVLLMWIA